jgi:hypothetical protein
MKAALKKPEAISADMLVQAASHGVTRAVEARKAAGVELSDCEAREVSGGSFLFIRGIPPAAMTNLVGAPVNPGAVVGTGAGL